MSKKKSAAKDRAAKWILDGDTPPPPEHRAMDRLLEILLPIAIEQIANCLENDTEKQVRRTLRGRGRFARWQLRRAARRAAVQDPELGRTWWRDNREEAIAAVDKAYSQANAAQLDELVAAAVEYRAEDADGDVLTAAMD